MYARLTSLLIKLREPESWHSKRRLESDDLVHGHLVLPGLNV